MVSCALVSVGDAAGFDGVGCSLGFGAAIARAGAGEASSSAETFGVGFGVLSGSGSPFFVLLDDFFLPDFVLVVDFFFLVFEAGEALFELLVEGVG